MLLLAIADWGGHVRMLRMYEYKSFCSGFGQHEAATLFGSGHCNFFLQELDTKGKNLDARID